MTTLRDILNRARWAAENLHDLELVVVHRGAAGDQRSIAGSRVIAVLPGGVEIAPDESDAESTFLPYHRFLSIRASEGALLWSKAQGTIAAAPVESAHATSESAAVAVAAAPALRVVETGVEVLPTFAVLLHQANTAQGLVIDGSAGEGGGQILRTSLSLSMLTGTPFTLERIRAGRKKPGLMRQHLTAVDRRRHSREHRAPRAHDGCRAPARHGAGTPQCNCEEPRPRERDVARGARPRRPRCHECVLRNRRARRQRRAGRRERR